MLNASSFAASVLSMKAKTQKQSMALALRVPPSQRLDLMLLCFSVQ